MSARRKRKRKPRKRAAGTRPRPELNRASRAQLGRDEGERPYRPRADDASVEDPLEDWPDEESP
jgi:hypothetical protein